MGYSVIIPRTADRIGSYTFIGSENLKSVMIPKDVSYIAPDTFSRIPTLRNIYCEFGKDSIKGAPWGAPKTCKITFNIIYEDKGLLEEEGESGGVDVSDTTATESDVLTGAKFHKADGTLAEGNIKTVTASLSGNVVTVPAGNIAKAQTLTVAEAGSPTVTENKVTIQKGYVPEQKTVTIPEASAPTVTDNKVTVHKGYIPEQKTLTVAEASAPTVSGNVVTVKKGYQTAEKKVTVGTAQAAKTYTPGTADQTIPAGTYLSGVQTIKGDSNLKAENIVKGKTIFGIPGSHECPESSGGAFDIVKVTEYSPYIPPYPDQIGYTVEISATNYDYESDSQVDYDLSAYEGLYTVTEETKGCTGFGRTFKNTNGKYLYAWTYDSWSQANDETSNAQWCISDDPSYSPDSGCIAAANSASSGVLPDAASGWSAPMGPHTIESCTLTPSVTSPATEAIPMVLKGSVASEYYMETRTFTDGTSSNDYTAFEQEPYKDWYYASVGGQLIGGAVSSNVQPSCYILFDAQKSTTETGQTLELTPNPSMAEPFKTIDGVKCLDFQNGGTIKVSPVDCLITGKTPFALSAFVRIDKKESNVYVLFYAYGTEWPPTRGFHLQLDDGYTFRLRGGNPKSSSGYDPLISTFSFPREKWVHITYVHYSEYEELYVNGTSVWWNKIKREFMESNLDYFTVGTDLNGGSFWDGYIAEFKYFSGAISQAQIKNEADRCLAMVTE